VNINVIKESLGEHWIGYRNALTEALENDSKLLTEINAYLIGSRGKELRPVLALLAAKICEEVSLEGRKIDNESYCCAAVAEMIHTATLLHDDVADNGKIRHGVPTVVATFSGAASVLSGDYWLAKALFLLSNRCEKRVLETYTNTVRELSVGELIQMEKAESLNTTDEDYYNIIQKKTASLFVAAVNGGAISTGASDFYLAKITEYACQLGIAFQIRDDIFDYSPQLNTGKAAGADILERKITLPLLCAMKSAGEVERGRILDTISSIADSKLLLGPVRDEDLSAAKAVTRFVQKFGGTESAQIILKKHINRAIECINAFPDSEARQYFISIARYVGERDS
jgi:octaprenyl-diphosphate synthase